MKITLTDRIQIRIDDRESVPGPVKEGVFIVVDGQWHEVTDRAVQYLMAALEARKI